jgi:hypothetical protein
MVFVLWGNAVYYGQYIKEHYQSVGVRMKGTGVTKRVLEQAVENERLKGNQGLQKLSAWNRLEDQSLECEELYTKSTVHLIEVYGDMSEAYPVELISGSLPSADDYEGCLIDKNTAYELYRTVHAVGKLLTYQGKKYCVRGIVQSSETVCLIEIQEEDKAFSNLELCFTDKENGGALAADFMRQYGLTSSYTEIDGSLYSRLLELAYLLPAWLLGFCLLYDLLAALWKRRRLPCQVLALMFLLVALWPLLCWLMEFDFYIPQQLIPTKWSDFSFWSRKLASLREWRRDITYLAPNYKDVLLQQYSRCCITYIAAATLGIITLITHERMLFSGNSKAGRFLLIALIECTVVAMLFKTGRIFTLPRGYLGMPIFYMIASDAFCWCRNYLTELRNRKGM